MKPGDCQLWASLLTRPRTERTTLRAYLDPLGEVLFIMRADSATIAANGLQADHLAIPRKEWRRLLSPPHLAAGSRLLVAGPQPAGLAEWLADLSFDVTAATDDAVAVLTGRRRHPRVEFLRASSDPRYLLPGHAFDAAFVQPMSAHGDNWLSSQARLFTAGLLAAIKPGGRLIAWRPTPVDDGHDDACWLRHLACFPGRIEAREVFDVVLPQLRRNPRRTVIVLWTSPPDWLSPSDWRTYARNGLLTDLRTCCPPADSTEVSAHRRAA